MGLIIYNPTSGPSLKELRMAKRDKPIEGSVIGLVDNGKKNSDTVIQYIAERLEQKYRLQDVIHYKKTSFSHGLTDAEASNLAQQCDFIISGVGD
ncbi:hypothetical protein M3234_07280 [Neobacillus niacini]|nr:hypothetical protein [Neobacillus niacini]